MRISVLVSCLFVVVALAGCAGLPSAEAQSRVETVTSPDGSVVAELAIGSGVTLSLEVDGQVVLAPSDIGLTVDGVDLAAAPVVTDVSRDSVREELTPVVREKRAVVAEAYEALVVTLESGLAVEVRAYDAGMAWRFATDLPGMVTINEETMRLAFEASDLAWFPREETFVSHNERLYEQVAVGELGAEDFASTPLLVDTGEVTLFVSESDLRDYAGLWVRGGEGGTLEGLFPKAVKSVDMIDDRNMDNFVREDFIAQTDGARTYPWRVVGVARDDSDLIDNQLVWLLGAPAEGDFSWVQPGQVAWDWWNANNIYGVDFRAGVNTQTYKYYIDFASAHGIEYVILDEGWYELGDMLAVVPEIDVPELVAYGAERDVKIILWAIWHTLDQDLEANLDQFAEWGAAGIKVDFMQRDDQWMVNYYWRVAEAAAERGLLVDYHGSHKPAGLRRTFPNVISYEGVRGLENNKWSDEPGPEHNTILPFIRMVAGPMDYTPGAMRNMGPNRETYADNFMRPASRTTRAHQVALYVIFESPLQMLADSPSNYWREPETVAFIAGVPPVWDETVPLSGEIGEHVAIARRSGETWYVGAITDENARPLELDFGFLPEGDYTAKVYADGINADRFAEDYTLREMAVDRSMTMTVDLAPGGGWAARIEPVN